MNAFPTKGTTVTMRTRVSAGPTSKAESQSRLRRDVFLETCMSNELTEQSQLWEDEP